MKQVEIDSATLAVADRGSGPPVLLVHGFPLDHAMWRHQIDALAAEYRVIAPDLRGFGASSVSPGVVTMERLADDLAELVDALDVREPITYCGLSMGGYVAWPFVRRHADRLRGLVLCDTRAVADAPQAADARRAMADRVVRQGPQPLIEAMMPKLLAPSTVDGQADLVETLREMMLSAPPEGIAAAARGMADRADSTDLLGDIDVPTLVIVGEHDALSTVDEMRGIAAAVPRAELAVISAAGHMAPMEQPAAVNARLREFLAAL